MDYTGYIPEDRSLHVIISCGSAIAQAVSRRFPTAAARVCSSGIIGEQSGAGAGFLRVLLFPLPKPFIPPTSPSSVTTGRYNKPEVADMPSGPNMDPTPTIRIKKKNK
jgi:hypothetical protein